MIRAATLRLGEFDMIDSRRRATNTASPTMWAAPLCFTLLVTATEAGLLRGGQIGLWRFNPFVALIGGDALCNEALQQPEIAVVNAPRRLAVPR